MRSRWTIVFWAFFALGSTLFARPIDFSRPVWDSDTLFGYWGGKKTLSEHGIYYLSVYVNDLDWPTEGGFKTTDYPLFLFAYNFEFGIDFDQLLKVPETSFFLSFIVHDGKQPTQNYIRDFQGVDNIEAYNLVQISELWAQKRFFDNTLAFTLGKMDVYGTFFYTDYAQYLMNNSYTQSPNILSFPTYPNTSVGVVTTYVYSHWLTFRSSVFDGSMAQGVRTGNRGAKLFFQNLGKHLFLLNEIDFSWNLFEKKYPGELMTGIWGFNGRLPTFNSEEMGKSVGTYLSFSQCLWKKAKGSKYKQKTPGELGIFAQWSYTNPQIAGAVYFLSGGITYENLLQKFEEDGITIAASTVFFSKSLGAPFIKSYETSFEMSYQVYVLPGIMIQPDIQWILNPGGGNNRNALVASLRLSFSI